MVETPVLKDRIALVTGASRGIGYEAALGLAKAGAHVVATARTQGGLEELDDAIFAATGKHATLIPFDLVDGGALVLVDCLDPKIQRLHAARCLAEYGGGVYRAQ